MVYKAAETGVQQLLEILFTSSAGKIVFDAYKDSLPLPEVVARNHGHEETARYLEDVTARYISRVIGTTNECGIKKIMAWMCNYTVFLLSCTLKGKQNCERETVDLFELITVSLYINTCIWALVHRIIGCSICAVYCL